MMRLEGWIAAAALLALAPSAALAASEANFKANTTGDLVELCGATPDNGLGTAAVNFCEGYLQGAVTVEMLNMAAFRGRKLFCLPDPPPTRAATMSEFATWARAAPDRMAQSPTDGLFRFLSERYPCPSSR
jgi:Rap1a immunity proteins